MKPIKHILPRFFATLAILFALIGARAASVDYFLKIDGIEGESTADGHKGEIEIQSFSWGVTRSPGSSSPVLVDISVAKGIDKSSTKLMEVCARGQHIPKAVLTCRKAGGGADYYKVTLENVLISSYQTGGSSSDVVPTDQISFNFTKIEFEYQPLDAAGGPSGPPVIGSWPGDPGTVPGTGE